MKIIPSRSHLDPEAIHRELLLAKEHVLRARQIAEEQRERIARLQSWSFDSIT
jgi:hypothetical protein